MRIDLENKLFHGDVNGHAFIALPNGDLVCDRVSDQIRDQMREQAAVEYLHARRKLRLSRSEADHWQRVYARAG